MQPAYETRPFLIGKQEYS